MSAKSTRSVKVFSSGAVDARNPRTAAPNDPHRSDCPGPPLAIRSDREPARASAPRLKHCPCLRHIFPANSQTASKSETLLEGITLSAHLQSKGAWALQKDSQAQRMSKENPQWGASRIHGELLMLGFEVAQSTVSKYMVRGGTPPSQSWKTFLRNHAQAIAAIDLCLVPTLTFAPF